VTFVLVLLLVLAPGLLMLLNRPRLAGLFSFLLFGLASCDNARAGAHVTAGINLGFGVVVCEGNVKCEVETAASRDFTLITGKQADPRKRHNQNIRDICNQSNARWRPESRNVGNTTTPQTRILKAQPSLCVNFHGDFGGTQVDREVRAICEKAITEHARPGERAIAAVNARGCNSPGAWRGRGRARECSSVKSRRWSR
jgi:hypothetical protein